MNKEKTVVILVNYNGYSDTIDCINSIRGSSFACDIIVVDNNSSGDDIRLIKNSDKDVMCIQNKDNLGFAGGNNVGIQKALEAGYEYLIILNNDTVIDRDMISYLVREADSSTISVPAMFYYDSIDEMWYGGGEINISTGNCEHKQYKTKRKCSFATGCCFCAKREIFEKVGLFDERFFMYFEDVEFSIKIQEKGLTIVYCPEAKLWHKVGKTAGNDSSPLSIYYNTRNRLNCVKEHAEFFKKWAYYYSLTSRCMRMLQHLVKNRKTWKAYKNGIIDHLNNKWGKVTAERFEA